MEEIKQLDQKEVEQIFELPNSWRDKGRQEGRQEEKRLIAIEMLKEGLPVEMVIKVTKLDHIEVEKLKETL